MLSTLLCGTGRSATEFRPISPGIERATLLAQTLPDAPLINVWVYRSTFAGDAKPRPCVLIGASGSNGLTGALLDEDQIPEHLPYVAAGCIVVAYDVDGAITAQTDPKFYTALIGAFAASGGGVKSAIAALEAARNLEPRIDTSRLFAAGHGSAANLALLLAANDHRVRAVVAFSPLGEVLERIGPTSIGAIDTALPGFKSFLERTQPLAVAGSITCPTMLFHPADDAVSPSAPTRALADAMKKSGNTVFLTEPNTGGHVQAMLDQGLTNAAAWLAEIARRIPTTRPAAGTEK